MKRTGSESPEDPTSPIEDTDQFGTEQVTPFFPLSCKVNNFIKALTLAYHVFSHIPQDNLDLAI